MKDEHSRMATDSICFAAERIRARIEEYVSELDRPSIVFRPKLSRDGNQWCALYGDDLQTGVAGFGNSPANAYADFDRAWWEKLPA